jgi:hypothetical protein
MLVDAQLYPQSIYFYSQTVEKTGKSIMALYLTGHKNKTESRALEKMSDYSHDLHKLSSAVSTIFVDIGRDLIMKQGKAGYQKPSQQAYKSIDSLKGHLQRNNMNALIESYSNSVKAIYEIHSHFEQQLPGENQDLKRVREIIKNPSTKYMEYNMLAMYLFPILDGMETYSRYPMDDVDTNNIKLLSTPEVGTSCVLLKEMVGELVDLVPLVWDRLETLRPKKL